MTVHDLADHRPHVVAHYRCRACDHRAVTVHPVGADASALECPRCGAADSETSATPFAAVVPLRPR